MAPRIDGSSAAPLNGYETAANDSPLATVRLGENTLPQVAERLGVDADLLLQANPQITNPNRLSVGQEIRLPSCSAQAHDTDASAPGHGGNSPALDVSTPISDPMARVIAQMQMGGGGQPDANHAAPVMFDSPVASIRSQNHDKLIADLARDPGEAHQAWKKLSPADRSAVMEKMEANYGKNFARQFAEIANKGKAEVVTRNYQPGTGPSPAQLTAQGYRLGWKTMGNAGVELEFWLQPSGKTVARDISTWNPGATPQGPPASSSNSSTEGARQVGPIEPPPPEDPRDKPWSLLGKMQQLNDEMRQLLAKNPVPWTELNLKMTLFNDAREKLDKLLRPEGDDSDPPEMGEDFYNQVTDAEDENRNIYDEATKLNPDWRQGIVVIPPGSDDD